MDFSANRLAALAGLASSEVRHEIVREQAEALNESAQARQADQNESEVRQAVRRTIRKMIAEGALDLDEFTGGSVRLMEEEEDMDEAADTHMSSPLPEEEEQPGDVLEEEDMEESSCVDEEEMMQEGDPEPGDPEEGDMEEGTLYEMDGELHMKMGDKTFKLVPAE